MKGRILLPALLLLMPFLALAQTHKGISVQLYILKPNGQPMNAVQLPVRAQVLSPNDCVLLDETHSSLDIVSGYMRAAVGAGARSASDKGLALTQVFGNLTPQTGLDSVSGATGTCNYTPQAQDIRKLKVSFTIGSDPVEASFTVRSSAFAVAADEAQTLQGKAPADFLQKNTSKNLTQSRIEEFFNLITTQVGKVVKFDGTNFVTTDSGISPTWSSITSVPAPISQVAGLSCVDGKVLKYSNGSIVCGTDNDTIPQAMEWDSIVNKPTTFTPSAHTHPVAQITGLGTLATKNSVGNAEVTDVAYSKLTGVPSTFAPSAHGHYFSDLQNQAGSYLSYKPNNTACEDGQVLKFDSASGHWICGSALSAALEAGFVKTDGSNPIVSTSGLFEIYDANQVSNVAIFSGSDANAGYAGTTLTADNSNYSAHGYMTTVIQKGAYLINDDSSFRAVFEAAQSGGMAPIDMISGSVNFKTVGGSVTFSDLDYDLWESTKFASIQRIGSDLSLEATTGKLILKGTSVDVNGKRLTGVATPVDATDAANKSFVESLVSASQVTSLDYSAITNKPSTFTPSAHSHNASDITAGILPVSRGGTGSGTLSGVNHLVVSSGLGNLTTFSSCSSGQILSFNATGDAVCANQFSLPSVGTAGTYAKVTTDAQGRVVSGSLLTASDIPSLDASKITSGSLSISGDISAGSVSASKQISGATVNAATNASSLDFADGNTVVSQNNCATTIALSNLKDGSTYTFVNSDTATTTQCSFSASGLTFKFSPANAARSSGGMTVYSFLRAGSLVFVSWGAGFQ